MNKWINKPEKDGWYWWARWVCNEFWIVDNDPVRVKIQGNKLLWLSDTDDRGNEIWDLMPLDGHKYSYIPKPKASKIPKN